ncbi:unnamed protein product [Cuscuta epithymum]|uniref:Uncharacterized protein n=1 Tax=Cuscuta epithymum TaxID=186058 RepID=A0AAV0CMT2_9ASTE|nr:unnamed protein product [Cuscuta epithymum]
MAVSLFINHFLIFFFLFFILDNSLRSSFFFNNNVVWSSNAKNSPPLPQAIGVMNGHEKDDDVVWVSKFYYQRKQLLEEKLPASIDRGRSPSPPPPPKPSPGSHEPRRPAAAPMADKISEDEGKTLQAEELTTNP